MKTLCEAVRLRILRLIEEHKITLYKLEQLSGVLHGTMMNIISLRNKAVNLGVLIQIAGAFNMTISEFLDDPMFHEDNIKVD